MQASTDTVPTKKNKKIIIKPKPSYILNSTTTMRQVKTIISEVLCQGKNKIFPVGITEKIKNNNNKCGTNATLPSQRTAAHGRAVIPYRVAKKCNLDIEQLDTFHAGVAVELINNEYFELKEQNDSCSKYLIDNIGGEQNVASFVSIKSVDGHSGSSYAEKCFKTFEPVIEQNCWESVKRKPEYINTKYEGSITTGNDKWHGHIHVDISGGNKKNKKNKQIPIEIQLFISYYDYAHPEVEIHIDANMIYYMLHCFNIEKYLPILKVTQFKEQLEMFLRGIYYDDGCLYGSHVMQKCLKIKDGKKVLVCPLTDKKISIDDFLIYKKSPESIQICHNDAISNENLYFDKTRKYIVTARRPQNLFWGTKRGNMQQQELTIDELWAEKKKQCDEHEWE
jgi:hypothetical protein